MSKITPRYIRFICLFSRHSLLARSPTERQPAAEVGGQRVRDDPAARQPRPDQLQHQEGRRQGLRSAQQPREAVSQQQQVRTVDRSRPSFH